MNETHIVLNPEDIRNNPMNNSTSKMLYSFSKQKRFQVQDRLNLPFYTLPDVQDKRTTSMGFGNKTVFEDVRDVPPPNMYNRRSDFEVSRKKGFSFGVSRENATAASMSIFTPSSVPGPGTYNPIHKQSRPSAAVKSRTIDHSLDEKIKVPGPGQYNTGFPSKCGKIMNSKYQSVRCPIISRSVVDTRKTQEDSRSPAPWSYSPIMITNKGAKQLREGKALRFSISKRLGVCTLNSNPGPGQQQHAYNLATIFRNSLVDPLC